MVDSAAQWADLEVMVAQVDSAAIMDSLLREFSQKGNFRKVDLHKVNCLWDNCHWDNYHSEAIFRLDLLAE
jgi:hypothetical protein